MDGINLDKNIIYKHASLRYFDKNEHHITRFCPDDILLMVFDGVLRFSQDGKLYEIGAGQYFIQKHGCMQEGKLPSDSPKYLYVHFSADWTEGKYILPSQGEFDYGALKHDMKALNGLCHGNAPYIEQAAVFFKIISSLYPRSTEVSPAGKIAAYLEDTLETEVTLNEIASKFNFSKNHIINIFKAEYGVTPFRYINGLRVKQAQQLLEITSDSTETVAIKCGFNDYSHFYKVFKNITGVSPVQWRSKRRKETYSENRD